MYGKEKGARNGCWGHWDQLLAQRMVIKEIILAHCFSAWRSILWVCLLNRGDGYHRTATSQTPTPLTHLYMDEIELLANGDKSWVANGLPWDFFLLKCFHQSRNVNLVELNRRKYVGTLATYQNQNSRHSIIKLWYCAVRISGTKCVLIVLFGTLIVLVEYAVFSMPGWLEGLSAVLFIS